MADKPRADYWSLENLGNDFLGLWLSWCLGLGPLGLSARCSTLKIAARTAPATPPGVVLRALSYEPGLGFEVFLGFLWVYLRFAPH